VTAARGLAVLGAPMESEAPAYYVSILRSGGDVSHRRRILAGLRALHDVTLVGTNGVVEICTVTPKPSL
jgi:hypothetical protein